MKEKIRTVIAEYLTVETNAVCAEKCFRSDFCCDSVTFVQLLFILEDIFGIEFEQADAYRFQTVGDITAHIEQHARSKG